MERGKFLRMTQHNEAQSKTKLVIWNHMVSVEVIVNDAFDAYARARGHRRFESGLDSVLAAGIWPSGLRSHGFLLHEYSRVPTCSQSAQRGPLLHQDQQD